MAGLGLEVDFVGVEVVIHGSGPAVLTPIVREQFVENRDL